MLQEIAARKPGRSAVLEDSGHWPHIDNPDASAAAIVPFLKRQLRISWS
jgi:pimeloyl-ACP methyl ester carboxylesterase